MKKVSIIGANGMLSVAFTKYYYGKDDVTVDVYGLEEPNGYSYNNFYQVNLLKDRIDYSKIIQSDVIIYASGAGVQAALNTDSSLMYALNVNAPIEITLQLKKNNYKGIYVSFGSYMEIGINKEMEKSFTEEEIVCSKLPVSNDYALSKRLYGRYMKDLIADYRFWHFILPNMFSYDDFKPGTRLIPYILQYIQDYLAGQKPSAPKFSAGTQKREFILMEDIFILIDNAMISGMSSGIYNVGGGKYQSIRELIESIFAYFNVPCKDEYFGSVTRRDGDIPSLRLDSSKLRKALNMAPSTTIEDVLRKTKGNFC